MKLDQEQIKHIAQLARLDLKPEEAELYGGQLKDILAYVEQLSEIDTAQEEPTAQVSGLTNAWRTDEAKPWPADEAAAALAQAPDKEGKLIRVKRVLDQ
ncbi:Asp-tRNA(Asn)/Glu-tRNA(Gln) amidotransferase GatCAB subunit C [Candidatus Falkowbacteria bacterium CG_4_10_14_0_2_um_filter_48_10]|uniref:Aspartyl/glutamyl-tRNA(Asn/Gln) amidotransferase subunit C n=1 Tax=Candidatus Falkowbacteria bacterium CG23_combo_of_CG06-09_8_20_14_all_49_15 TaxID=1974572 RepID=A0A2G9ZLA1_9BACT|nr:MAG: Asp-tRNA(Asn)/Glu-tRNA(Gln) amidotransferase GatCAB subunit C [Candidatus Falkowbacteria bacterium CG23_combo_of_CG06-09_8_20_14_all_49_15]PJA08590.1 MAG: Asp-tRNA(Asn)/Glu-tRNA(Gln) amidotransferase GatCAB subunit C [Candidatus Falkowbacteria bacterium CG_4_10_14_0_2_um_filter_48_10]